jgi:hypothetical protein
MPWTRAASAHNGGLKPSASRAPAGHRIRIGMHGDALTSGSKHRTAAKAETTGCARASHRAFDSQRRGRSRSAVWCPARRRCALATRSRQWSARRPSVTISNRRARRSIRNGISKDRDHGICPFPVDPPATTCHMQRLAGGAELQRPASILSQRSWEPSHGHATAKNLRSPTLATTMPMSSCSAVSVKHGPEIRKAPSQISSHAGKTPRP